MNNSKYALTLEAQRPAPRPEKSDDLPMSVSEIADRLGWSRRKVEKLRDAGLIPSHRIGNSYPYYYLAEVKEALRNNGATATTSAAD